MSHKLQKKEIFSVALGSVIGWGAFVLPGNVFLKDYGLLNTAIGFTIAVFMLVFIEKSYSMVMERVPKSGGEYSFANDLLGKKTAFVTGWGLLLAYISIIPLNATAVPMVLDKVFPSYSKGSLLYTVSGYEVFSNDVLVSLSIIIFFIIINLRGLKDAALAQKICVFTLVFSLMVITLFTFGSIGEVEQQNLQSNLGTIDTASIIRIIAFAPWAFIGFDTVAQLAGDHRIAAKTVSRVTLLAIIIGALIYNVLNLITALGVNSTELDAVSWQTGQAVKTLVGNGLFYLLGVAMFGAVISGLNGFFIGSSRLVLSMSQDYDIGTQSLNNKSDADLRATKNVETVENAGTSSGSINIPKWIIFFIGGCSLMVPFLGRNALLWFVDLSSVGASIAYLVTCVCAYKIAETGTGKFISIMGVLVSFAFLVFLLTPFFDSNITMPSYYVLILWCVLGLMVYLFLNKSKPNVSLN